MTTSVAFFISPQGHLIDVPLNHISMVIADPEKFGLTIEEIRASYAMHGERIGVEGEARQKLLLKIISQDGFVSEDTRIYWSVTAPCLSPAIWKQSSGLGWADVVRHKSLQRST